METITDILREMRTLGRLDEKSTDKIPRSLQALGLRTFADRIQAAYKREFDEAARALDKLADGICSHCDMQRDCAEGEDGMSTMCNAMYDVRKFIEEHKKEDKDNEFPF